MKVNALLDTQKEIFLFFEWNARFAALDFFSKMFCHDGWHFATACD